MQTLALSRLSVEPPLCRCIDIVPNVPPKPNFLHIAQCQGHSRCSTHGR